MRDAFNRWAHRTALEQGALLASLVKWTLLATAAGMLAGAATAGFLELLGIAVRSVARVPFALLLCAPGFLAAYMLVHLFARDAEGHGTDKVIEAVHERWGHIPAMVAPVKLVATIVTIAVGGSVGKEGPAAQISAALASTLGRMLMLRRGDHRKLVICGIGAGFAAVFGTPIAGAVFGVEVLVMGSLFYEVLYPSFVSGIVSCFVAQRLGVTYFHDSLPRVPVVTEAIFAKTVVAGVVFGLVALVLIELLRGASALTARVRAPRWLVACGGGGVIALLAAMTSTRYLGLGLDTVDDALRGQPLPMSAWLMKAFFTAISLGTGGSGGVVTPIFFVGATAGSALGDLLGFDRGFFAAVGMVAVLAAAANAPVAGSIMALELFGASIGPYAGLAAIVSFLIVGHRSVYGSQLLGAAKSGSLLVPDDVAVDTLEQLGLRRRTSRRRALMRLLRRRARRGRGETPPSNLRP
jgi:H+/Cl- antiporter ClcA